mmetsp:Transcript_43905/g.73122  ORF Transcript_43905/g.73122 Transcript_43905/m.73122 type:complete len:146 (+) Transcript_43905:1671-2108(+)
MLRACTEDFDVLRKFYYEPEMGINEFLGVILEFRNNFRKSELELEEKRKRAAHRKRQEEMKKLLKEKRAENAKNGNSDHAEDDDEHRSGQPRRGSAIVKRKKARRFSRQARRFSAVERGIGDGCGSFWGHSVSPRSIMLLWNHIV